MKGWFLTVYIEKETLVSALNDIETKFKSYSLPKWDELPDIELYMDQIISLLEKYLKIYYETLGAEKTITSSMINNYVKLGTIPPPIKKRYSKIHLAYLLVVCTLKQTHDMATIQKIIPVELSAAEVEQTYTSFVKNQQKANSYVIENIRSVADPIIDLEGNNQERLNDILIQLSTSANIFKTLTEALTKIHETKK